MSSLFHPVQSILDKLAKQEDVDVRFMMLRDLAKELAKLAANNTEHADPAAAAAAASAAAPPPPALDVRAQEKLCRVLQVQLLCTQGEVAEAAVRCLPGLLCSAGEAALSSLLSHLLHASFDPASALPPEHLQSEEVADDREREARLESIRLKALQAIKVLWREMTHAEPRERVARLIVPPVIKLVQQTTEGKAKSTPAASSSSQPSVASMLQTPQLPFPKLTLGQLLDFVPFLHALLSAHPSSLVPFHSALLGLFHSLLLFEGSGLLQLSMDCVNATAPFLSADSLAAFVHMLCGSWASFQARKRESAFFAAMGTIVRVAGNAFQPFLAQVLPMLHEVMDQGRYESSQEEREAALLCVEHIVRSAAAAALPHFLSLLPSIDRAANYDPNFVGDAHASDVSANHAPMSTGAGAGEDDDGEEEDYGLGGDDDDEDNGLNDFVDDGASDGNASDDEDSSWKVRRASARCVHAMMGAVMVVSGSANEQQAQAFATALPPLWVSTHASANRAVVEHVTVALANLLLPRLTERSDHIQADLLGHYEQLMLWASRCAVTKHLDLTASTVGGPTLQQQLGRLLGVTIKAKPSTSDLRTLEQVASLLSTATRAVPAARWSIQHAHVFSLLTRRSTECFALLLPGAHSLAHVLSLLVHCITAMQHAWQRLPSPVWASEAGAWSGLMFKHVASLKDADRTAASPMLALNLACVRALSALVPAVRQACSELNQARVVQFEHVLPYSQMDASLESAHGARCSEHSPAGADGAGSWMVTEQAAVALMADIQRACVSVLQDARSDRSLQSQALQSMTRLSSVLFPLTLGSVAHTSTAATLKLLADSQAAVWSTMLRLCEFPTTRVVACESFHAMLSVAQVTPVASVHSMLHPLVPMLNQRDRPLLRATILALRTFVARALLSNQHQRDTEAMWPTLQQAVLPIVAFCTESGELVVEQSCALVLLANILQLLSLSAPLRGSTHSLLVTHVFPTLVEWVAAHPDVDLLTLQAIQAVYAAAAHFAQDAQQHAEWTTALRAQASHATEEATRTSLSALLAAQLFGARSSPAPLADLGAPLSGAGLSSEEAKQLADLIGHEAKAAANAEVHASARIVAIRTMGHLVHASAGCHSLLLTTASASASSLLLSLAMSADAASPLSLAASDYLGFACTTKSDAELRALVSHWHETPSAQLNAAFGEFTRLLAASGIVNLESAAMVPAGGAASSSSSAIVSAVSPTLLAHADASRRLDVSHLQPLLSPLLSSALVALHAPQVDVPVLSQLLSNLCLLAPNMCLQAMTPMFAGAPVATQRSLGPDAQQVLLRALQRFLALHHAQYKQWRMRRSNQVSTPQQEVVWESVSRAFVASFVLFSSTDLALLVRCVELVRALTSVQPALVVPHLRALVALLRPLSVRQPQHVREVSYGPSTKSVDTGIELRLAVWRAMVSLSALLSLQSPRALEDAAMCATLQGMLLGGLGDPAAEVKLAVHTALLQLTQRIAMTEAQWAQMAQALAASIQAPPPENAVQEEVLVHAEVVASATRAGDQLVAMLAQMERFPATAHTHIISQARAQLQQVVEAQQNEQKRRNMHKIT